MEHVAEAYVERKMRKSVEGKATEFKNIPHIKLFTDSSVLLYSVSLCSFIVAGFVKHELKFR